jgi:hypothetical protein
MSARRSHLLVSTDQLHQLANRQSTLLMGGPIANPGGDTMGIFTERRWRRSSLTSICS